LWGWGGPAWAVNAILNDSALRRKPAGDGAPQF
jgi:hypothetical protein